MVAIPQNLIRIRFQILLTMLLILFVVVPYFEINILTDIVLSILFISALFVFSEKRNLAIVSIFICVVALVSGWASYWRSSTQLEVVANLFEIAFTGIVIVAILQHVFQAVSITRETIAGAICVYLFIGLLWANVYALQDIAQPQSFSNLDISEQQRNPHLRAAQFTYFSFVTLSTLGYGDITPKARQAKSLAAMEAILGQLYLAVLIARLVGQQVSPHNEKREK
jgi:voltage-gated potassium channel